MAEIFQIANDSAKGIRMDESICPKIGLHQTKGMLRSFARNSKHNLHALANKIVRSGPVCSSGLLSPLKRYEDIFFYNAIMPGNNYYGIEKAIKSYCRYQGTIFAAIEHGVYFGDYVNKHEADVNFLPALITFGAVRASHIRQVSDIPVLKIGPYIYYADDYLSDEELLQIKEQNGKTMLVFPTHSNEGIAVRYSIEELAERVNEVANEGHFATVLYCLYFNDINSGLGELYERAGLKVVCAGHRSDPLFLPRLKSLIKASDLTVSNSVGSHIGYSECLGVRHKIIQVESQKDREHQLTKTALANSESKKKAEVEEVYLAFSGNDSRRRKDVLNKYWGFDYVLGPEELNEAMVGFNAAHIAMAKKGITAIQAVKYIPDDLHRFPFANMTMEAEQ